MLTLAPLVPLLLLVLFGARTYPFGMPPGCRNCHAAVPGNCGGGLDARAIWDAFGVAES